MKRSLLVIGYLGIAALILGGLGWATRAALALEQERLEQQAASDHAEKVRLALWRLDGRLAALLAGEDGRPYSHYSAVFVPPVALSNVAQSWPAGSVLEPSPLLNVELPSWMLLHFQVDERGWESPQVLSARLDRQLRKPGLKVDLCNVEKPREQWLARLAREIPAERLLAAARKHTRPATIQNRVLLATLDKLDQQQQTANWRDYATRAGTRSRLVNPPKDNRQVFDRDVVMFNCLRNGEEWLNPNGNTLLKQGDGGRLALPQMLGSRVVAGTEAVVSMSPMAGAWVRAGGAERLMLLRLVQLEEREACQGVLLDADELAKLLAEEVRDLFPQAALRPVRESSA
ncbi:MAG: hypothetical protein K2W96_06630, partial [Gemmataceae bacterium]|nr:hypothetical protein [Gemmataceae bacterium]